MSTTPTPTPERPLRLHRFALSGHAHRVELFLSLLGLPYENVDVDLPNPRSLDMINTDRFGAYVTSIRANLQASGGLD